jgi:hypothetical protein
VGAGPVGGRCVGPVSSEDADSGQNSDAPPAFYGER